MISASECTDSPYFEPDRYIWDMRTRRGDRLSGFSIIVMIPATRNGNFLYLSRWPNKRAGDRNGLAQALMGVQGIVIGLVRSEGPGQMLLAQDDEMVEAFTTNAQNDLLRRAEQLADFNLSKVHFTLNHCTSVLSLPV